MTVDDGGGGSGAHIGTSPPVAVTSGTSASILPLRTPSFPPSSTNTTATSTTNTSTRTSTSRLAPSTSSLAGTAGSTSNTTPNHHPAPHNPDPNLLPPQPGLAPAGPNAAPAPPPTSAAAAAAAAAALPSSLPSAQTQLHIAEARAALVASVSNLLDGELQGRASLLHGNAAGLERQGREVARATAALRRDGDRLARLAADAGRRVKELGNVQNWAEVLERDFLVLEETARLVREGGAAHSDAGSGASGDERGSSCSCSECWSGSASRSGSGSLSGSRRGSVGAADGKGKKAASAADGKPRVAVEVDLSDAVIESLSEAMATEAFFTPGGAVGDPLRNAHTSDSGAGEVLLRDAPAPGGGADTGKGKGKGKGPATELAGSEARDTSSEAEPGEPAQTANPPGSA